MKINKKIRMIILSTALVFGSVLLTACQDNQKTTNDKDQTQTSENQTNAEETIDTSSQNTKDEEKKDQTEKNKKPMSDVKKIDKKNNKNTKNVKQAKIVYYTFDINTEKLTENTKQVDEVSVGNIVKAMVEKKMLQAGTEVKTAKVTEINGVKTLVVDMNDKFVNFDQGSTSESLTLRCFANSLVKTFKVEQVKLSVDGQNYSGGHIALKDGEYLKYK